MKKSIIAVLLASVLPVTAFAQGYHVDGNVYASDTSLSGAMSVRYNTSVSGSPYIYANGYANSAVSFYGRDSDGDNFVCSVPTTSALYDQAVDIKNSLTNGGYLYVSKPSSSSTCSSVYLLNASYWTE
ncbi:MAG: hypothetical protein P8Y45_20915 [Exilibacterium sp.]